MGEEIVALCLSLLSGFIIVVVYLSLRRGLSPNLSATASVVVIIGAPVSLLFGRNAPLVNALLGLVIAIVADAISTAARGTKKRGG